MYNEIWGRKPCFAYELYCNDCFLSEMTQHSQMLFCNKLTSHIVVGRVLRLRRNTHWQFWQPTFPLNGILGTGCLIDLTSSSTRVGRAYRLPGADLTIHTIMKFHCFHFTFRGKGTSALIVWIVDCHTIVVPVRTSDILTRTHDVVQKFPPGSIAPQFTVARLSLQKLPKVAVAKAIAKIGSIWTRRVRICWS